MKSKMLQIMTLCGGYFIISSVLGMVSYIFHQIFAVSFPFFLIIISFLSVRSKLSQIIKFQVKYPNLILLLNIMGGYVLIYFLINMIIIPLVPYVSDFKDFIDGVISIGFFIALFIALLIILVKKINK